MTSDPSILDRPLSDIARALRRGETSARALLETATTRRTSRRPALDAWCFIDPAAEEAAERADRRLRGDAHEPGPLCGLPVSVKDLYGVRGQPVWAGTARALPDAWSAEGWLVSELRRQGAVLVGRTTTVELAYGAVGTNPHHGTPRNPHDDEHHRIPGGSSAGAGVSLVEGSAVVALGTDTGGSIRIPASLTGTVGLKTTVGRWPTDGVVPLSTTLDTVGALTRSVADAAWFFAAVDPRWGEPARFVAEPSAPAVKPLRLGRPAARIFADLDPSIAGVVDGAFERLADAGAAVGTPVDGRLVDEAEALYMEGCIVAAECSRLIADHLPEWTELLDPRVAARLRDAPGLDSARYLGDQARREALAARAPALFDGVDLLAWPTHLDSPARVAELDTIERYLAVNRRLLSSTCVVNTLGLCALTLPVGTDDSGMPVGLHLVAPADRDEELLRAALRIEDALLHSAGGSTVHAL
ncbi:amidase [Gaopeijia maritima]|uniref:amidase n=1 Tax=Gaopeijia maritima TaxID=3119007 RepID=UPI00327E9552